MEEGFESETGGDGMRVLREGGERRRCLAE